MYVTRHLGVTPVLVLACTLPAFASDLSRWFQVSKGDWKVSRSTTLEIEQNLKDLLPSQKPSEGEPRRGIEKYTVQYQGITASGEKLVAVAGACNVVKRPRKQLTRDWIRVLDGGSCYFEATYDPIRKQLVRFVFNGVA
jgi:hypothetical protein